MRKYRITNTILLATLFMALVQSWSVAGPDGKDNFIARAKEAAVKYKLTARPMECLIFEVAEEKYEGKILVDVRENHGGNCGGDPATSPRAFSIAFDDKTNEVWSDANSLLGQLEKLK